MGHHPIQAAPIIQPVPSGMTSMTWILIGIGAAVVASVVYYIYKFRK